ncbi:hypothetical protein [Enterococcus phage TJE2]|jgi:hypothetical protein|uniref:Uncharacterized protein n=3 Tax=Schiekvirus TaxID=2732968 RepID=A0AAE9HG79_9CAUD|nr:hypothetical protein [Enterococcus phage GVEsP-1]UPW35426.1 hypothetical protein KEBGJNKE_00211 [Enterococcus phage vB_OCPT_Bop]UVD43284.1 hypothetical protein [Enterococcus phage TJE2]
MENTKKYTLEGLKQLAKESGFEIEEVKPKLHDINRYYWSGSIYGGSDFIFIDHDLKIIVTGNTRATKSDMYTRNNTECKRKRDLNEEKAYYEGLGYQVFNNGAFSYEALRLLQNGSVNRSVNKEYSLQELLDMKD